MRLAALSVCTGGGATLSGPGAAEGVQGIEELKATLAAMVPAEPRPRSNKPFLFSVDHCFPIKGQGTVLTGTVLQVRYVDPLPDVSL
jgi:selenocysteine-specific elongation factor